MGWVPKAHHWLSPFWPVEEARNAEGGPGCMCVVEAAVVMEGLVQCPVQTCLVLRSCLGFYP